MLVLGKAGSAGTAKGVQPVLHDGSVVATIRTSNWKDAATATIGAQPWVLTKNKRSLSARWVTEPEDAVRLCATQTSMWKDTWEVDLEGRPVEVQTASRWKGTHRYLIDGRTVAESGTTGGWSPRPTLTAEPDLPLHHQVFLLWLELILGRRDSAAAAAGA